MRGTWLVLLACVACGKVNNNPADGPPPPPGDGTGSDGSGSDAPGAAPTITALTPDWGSSAGGTMVTVNGTGFSAAGLAVKFGAVDAVATVVNDTTLTLTAPSNLIRPVKVTVTTVNGTGTSAIDFRYLAPLYAADGAAGTLGNLYVVDPASAASTIVGPINFAVTGMAISPDGVLFGATSAGGTAGAPSLITIDPYTGAGLLIGPLKTSAGAGAGCSDIVFDGAVLRGWHAKQLATINTTTAIATLAPPTLATVTGVAGNSIGELGGQFVVSPSKANGTLFKLNIQTGVATAGPTLSGPAQSMGAMTRVGPTLFGSVNGVTGGNPPAQLYTVNPNTGAMVLRGNLPLRIDAIAGIP